MYLSLSGRDLLGLPIRKLSSDAMNREAAKRSAELFPPSLRGGERRGLGQGPIKTVRHNYRAPATAVLDSIFDCIRRKIAHTNPASSRATATSTLLFSFLRADSFTIRL